MALWEEVQDIAEQFSEMTEAEVEEDLQWHFEHIEPWHRERKKHDGDGWFSPNRYSPEDHQEMNLTTEEVRELRDWLEHRAHKLREHADFIERKRAGIE